MLLKAFGRGMTIKGKKNLEESTQTILDWVIDAEKESIDGIKNIKLKAKHY